MKLFQCDHAIDAQVLFGGVPATVVAVTFTRTAVLYRLDFAAGGAQQEVPSSDVKAA